MRARVTIQKILGLENIDNLSEDQFRLVMKSLWATGFWTNKDYPINKILEDNGISKIRQELKKLIYVSDSIDNRFDAFRSNIKGVIPSSITDILVFMYPKKCCLWNEKPKNVLPFRGMENYLPGKVFRYSINGADYEKCINILGLVKDELNSNGIENPEWDDLVDPKYNFLVDKHSHKHEGPIRNDAYIWDIFGLP